MGDREKQAGEEVGGAQRAVTQARALRDGLLDETAENDLLQHRVNRGVEQEVPGGAKHPARIRGGLLPADYEADRNRGGQRDEQMPVAQRPDPATHSKADGRLRFADGN